MVYLALQGKDKDSQMKASYQQIVVNIAIQHNSRYSNEEFVYNVG